MDTFSSVKRIVVGKLESVNGVAETLASSDFDVRARGAEFSPDLTNDDDNSKFATGDYLGDEAVSGIQGSGVGFSTKLAGSGDVTIEPKLFKMLKACGMVSKSYTTTGVALQDSKEGDLNTITLGVFDIKAGTTPTAVSEITAGAMGNAVISVDGVGGSINVTYDFKGKFDSYVDVSNANILELTSPNTTIAEAFKGIALTYGGTSICVQNFSLDLGNSVENVLCPDENTGIEYAKIGGREPRLTLVLLKKDVADFDTLTKWKSQSVDSFIITFANYILTVPRCQILGYSNTDESGSVAQSLNIKLLRNGTSDSDIDESASFELLLGARA